MVRARGFSLLEVMVALGILGLALTAIVQINGTAITTHDYSKRVTVATLLARSKMADLESQFIEEGFTSDFDQKITGDFSDEGWEDFRWEAEIVKPDLDAANATALVTQLMEKLAGDAETAHREQNEGGPVPQVASMMQQQMGGMVEAQVQQLVTLLDDSLREVRLKVSWGEGDAADSVDVTTHLVVLAPADQPGGPGSNMPPPPPGSTPLQPGGTP